MYKRIAAIRTGADANDVRDELCDRFGTPPESINGLIEISLLRNSAASLGVYEIAQRNGSVLLYMNEPDVRYAVELNKVMKGRVLLSASKKHISPLRLAQNHRLKRCARLWNLCSRQSAILIKIKPVRKCCCNKN